MKRIGFLCELIERNFTKKKFSKEKYGHIKLKIRRNKKLQ